ncbi:MAG TPA: hypothetical protein VGJ29_12135 [Vicinamibacterales bacterium]
MTHYTEDDLALYYYGEGRPAEIDRHLTECRACAALYREIAGTLAMIPVPEAPERSSEYGLEVWQRIRHRLPEQDGSSWAAPRNVFKTFRFDQLALVAAAAVLLIAAFVAGRVWPGGQSPRPALSPVATTAPTSGDVDHRILLTSVADHLDRSGRVLSDIMNASSAGDISAEQTWAEDLLTTSRLYRQDATDAGERSVAAVLDELERNLIEIVHSPSTISQADLDQIRHRIDAAALLFKVRVMSDELRQREQSPADTRLPRTSTRKVS